MQTEPDEAEAEQYYLQGNALFLKSKYRQSVPFFEKAANLNYQPAFLRLGRIFRSGDMNMKMDQKKTDLYFSKISLAWFQSKAAQEEADDLLNLGLCYSYGAGVSPDPDLEFKTFALAAEKNSARAQYCVAVCYENGTGVVADSEMAFCYYTLAAEQNDIHAIYNLGVTFDTGEKGDLEKARKFYKLAADQGHTKAQFNLGLCYKEMETKDPSYGPLWKHYFGLAAAENHPKALFGLGAYHADKDPNLSMIYFQRASDVGNILYPKLSGYKLGSRTACYNFKEHCLILLLQKNSLALPEIWRLIVLSIMSSEISILLP